MSGKITGNSPVLEVQIDPASFGEFNRFNNLKFQVDESVKNSIPKIQTRSGMMLAWNVPASPEHTSLNSVMRGERYPTLPGRYWRARTWKKRGWCTKRRWSFSKTDSPTAADEVRQKPVPGRLGKAVGNR
jgi:hypothetical protein